MVALDVDPYGASTVVGNFGECFDEPIGAEWTSLIPRVGVGVEMLEPGGKDAWRVPGIFQMPEYSV